MAHGQQRTPRRRRVPDFAAGRALAVAAGACFVVGFALRAHGLWAFTVDDTFITLRYAKHLAAGLGPAWNPEGPLVEGYTSVLWMLLLSLPHLLGLDALTFTKLASCLGGLACAGLSSRLAWRIARAGDTGTRLVAAAVSLAVCAAYGPLVVHAVSGMETTAFALFLTLFFDAALALSDAPSTRGARTLALFALLATLTRPEGALVCGVTLTALAWRTQALERARLLRAVATFTLAPGLVYFVARYLRYGLLLPLPFYVKATGHTALAGRDDVVRFLAPFLLEQPYLGLAFALALVRLRARLVPQALGVLSLLVFFLFPAHVMGFEGRYLFPVFPALAAWIGAGAGAVVDALAQRVRARHAPFAFAPAFGLIAALALLPLPRARAGEELRWTRYGHGLERAHIALGRELARMRRRTSQPSIALLDVGAVAYYGEWRVIDTFGLNDAHVALSRRADVDYVLDQRPDLLVVVSAARERFVDVFDWEAPLHTAATARGYAFACAYEFEPDYYLRVLARPDSALGQAFARAKNHGPGPARIGNETASNGAHFP